MTGGASLGARFDPVVVHLCGTCALSNQFGIGEETDEALIRRIASTRDREAFTALFRRFAGPIRGILMKGGASHGEADEAMQEAMIAIWRRADSFDPERASAATWIFTIARNRRIDLIRKTGRPAPDPDDPLFNPDPEPATETVVSAADRDRAVREAVMSLDDGQREVLTLLYFGGLTQQEAAETLGLPLGTVKSRMRLAAQKLRHALGEDFATELEA